VIGEDLDWRGEWTAPLLPRLRALRARRVLELGCGTGHDAARLAREGHEVVAVDFSRAAISRARVLHGEGADFRIADIAEPLPFPDSPTSWSATK